MKRSDVRIGLYMSTVFLSGVLVGGFSHRAYSVKAVVPDKPPKAKSADDYRKKYIQELKVKIGVNEAQIVDIHRILDETKQRYRAAHHKIEPEMKQIQEDQVAQIRQILTEQQRPKYDDFRQERERRKRASKSK